MVIVCITMHSYKVKQIINVIFQINHKKLSHNFFHEKSIVDIFIVSPPSNKSISSEKEKN